MTTTTKKMMTLMRTYIHASIHTHTHTYSQPDRRTDTCTPLSARVCVCTFDPLCLPRGRCWRPLPGAPWSLRGGPSGPLPSALSHPLWRSFWGFVRKGFCRVVTGLAWLIEDLLLRCRNLVIVCFISCHDFRQARQDTC